MFIIGILTREPVYEKNLIVPVNYVNNNENKLQKSEEVNMHIFIRMEIYTNISRLRNWFNNSKALNHIQNYLDINKIDLDDRN